MFISTVGRMVQAGSCVLVLALGLGGCGLDECATLRRLCEDQCTLEIKRACLEIVAEDDEKLCRASYRGYARYCPDWDLFDDED